MKISEGDKIFIQDTLMPWAGVARLRLAYSESKAKWPDIWVSTNGIPTITITDEWRSHDTHLRRSQLVHEFLHLRGMEHGKLSNLNFSTYPGKDTYSKAVYQDIINGR